jgi:hypothetical protein
MTGREVRDGGGNSPVTGVNFFPNEKENLMELKESEWRCYHFGNFYLSSIQQGIQAAHAQMELFNKYCPHKHNDQMVDDSPAIDMLFEWSNNHKTMICLNGGMNSDLAETHILLNDVSNPYPTATFRESEEALGGIIGSIAIVIPEEIFGTSDLLRRRQGFIVDNKFYQTTEDMNEYIRTFTDFEIALINRLIPCGLAS